MFAGRKGCAAAVAMLSDARERPVLAINLLAFTPYLTNKWGNLGLISTAASLPRRYKILVFRDAQSQRQPAGLPGD